MTGLMHGAYRYHHSGLTKFSLVPGSKTGKEESAKGSKSGAGEQYVIVEVTDGKPDSASSAKRSKHERLDFESCSFYFVIWQKYALKSSRAFFASHVSLYLTVLTSKISQAVCCCLASLIGEICA